MMPEGYDWHHHYQHRAIYKAEDLRAAMRLQPWSSVFYLLHETFDATT